MLNVNTLTSTLMQVKNEVVIWDYIVRNQSEARLIFSNWFVKYPLISQGADMRGRAVNLTLHWDVMPLTGLLYFDTKGSAEVQLPQDYCPNGCEAGPVQASI
jgi:signal peptidase complex subunit 3